jgi:ABC-type lipoprotein release transport system permease subunit
MYKYRLTFDFFKKSLVVIAISQLAVTILFLFLLGLKESYNMKLKEEFATKQPHIKIKYISQNKIIDTQTQQQQIDKILKLSNKISAVIPFTSGDRFLEITGSKEGGNAFFNGDVRVIGLGKEALVYNFFEQSFASQEPFEVPYTSLEFLYDWEQDDNLSVFNQTLINSFYPVAGAISKFECKSDNDTFNIRLSGSFSDFDTKPILYASINKVNEILNKNGIDGYFLNASSLEDIEIVLDQLKLALPKDEFVITSWIEDKKKQMMIFNLFQTMFFIVISIISILVFLITMLLIYNSIVKKGYQLTVLKWLGHLFTKEICIWLVIVILLPTIFGCGIYWLCIGNITDYFGLPNIQNFAVSHLINIWYFVAIYLVLGYYVIKEAYNANISQSLE